jgi:autotransporter-associated beta strand protein
MKNRKSVFISTMTAVAAVVIIGSADRASASPVTWQNAQTATTDADVNTGGSSVLAAYYAGSGTTTVNGVTFTATAGGTITQNGVTATAAGWWGVGGDFTYGTLSGSYKTLLDTPVWSGDGSITLTLTGLTVGQPYFVQLWSYDSRWNAGNQSAVVSAGGTDTNVQTLHYKDAIAGQFVIGAFTADSGTEVFTFTSASSSPIINAFQVRAGVPTFVNQTWQNASSNATWDTSSLNWDSGLAWTNDNLAIFGATGAGAVTIDAGGVSAGSLAFDAPGYTIGGGPLTLSGSSVSANQDATITSVIAGTHGLDKSGTGTLTLAAANTYTGTTMVSGGALQLGDGTSGHDGSLASTTIADGASVGFNNFGAVTYGGTISGSGGFAKAGAGTLTLTGQSNYTGNTTVNGGVLDISGGMLYNGVTSSVPVLTVNSGATLRVSNFGQWWGGQCLGMLGTTSSQLVVNGGTIDMANPYYSWDTRNFTIGALGATLAVSQAGGQWQLRVDTSPLVNDSSLTLTGAGYGQMDMLITGSGALTKNGGGIWALTNTNSYSGATTINAGRLDVNGATATLGTNSAVTLANDATAKLQTFWWSDTANNNIGTSFSIGSLAGGGTTGGNVALGQTATLTVGTDNTSTTYGGVISELWGAAHLTKTGTGTLTLTNTNYYSGTTTISGGTLQLGDGSSGHDGTLASPNIVNHSNLVFSLAGSSSYSGAISGSGTTTVKTGILNLTGSIAPTGSLAIDSGAVLHLPNYGYAIVSALVIHGVSQPAGAYDASNTGGAITGPGVLLVGGFAPPSAAYQAWATSITGFTDTYPTHDQDGDGMTNQQEFAFGLDPISGASNNPIIVPLDKATGTFTYTRLAPAVSGLTYKVYTSTNLSTWTEDAGAVEDDPTSLGYDVESVKVTLSGLPLTAPKLFVRVAAE